MRQRASGPREDAVPEAAVTAPKRPASRRIALVVDRCALARELRSGPQARDTQRAVTQFQQLSAPVAAKAVEDTAFYRYGRLLSRNDVGFEADVLGDGAADFHARGAAPPGRFPARDARNRDA